MVALSSVSGTLSHFVPRPTSDPVVWASAQVIASDQDVSGLDLTLQVASRVTGRLVFDAATLAPPTALNSVRLTLAAPTDGMPTVINGVMFGRPSTGNAQIAPDGTFEFSGVLPGIYQVTVVVPGATGWWPRSAIANGADALDTLLTVPPASGDITGLTVTLTDRRSELRARCKRRPVHPQPTIPSSRSRAIARSGAPTAAGLAPHGRPLTAASRSAISQPGEYHLAALTDLDPDNWRTEAFLSQIVTASLRVTIGEGERKVQDLKIAR